MGDNVSNVPSMKIICAGLAKTGTPSLASALRILGYKVYEYPEHVAFNGEEWLDIYMKGKSPHFVSMYKDVDAVTDRPPAFWFQEISEAFPDAKVILTVRDSEKVWLKSYMKLNDVLRTLNGSGFLTKLFIKRWSHCTYYALADVMDNAAMGSLQTESTILFKKKYREHNERVKVVIPEERLLVFNVKQGWKPLCKFLGCEIPEEDFPWLNAGQSDSLQGLAQRKQEFALTVLKVLSFLVVLFCLAYYVNHVDLITEVFP